MKLNRVMAVDMRYSTEFGKFLGKLRQKGNFREFFANRGTFGFSKENSRWPWFSVTSANIEIGDILLNRVRPRSRRTFSTHFEIFRRRFDSVVIYFFFKFRLQIFRRRVGIFSQFLLFFLFKVHVRLSSSQVSIGTRD